MCRLISGLQRIIQTQHSEGLGPVLVLSMKFRESTVLRHDR